MSTTKRLIYKVAKFNNEKISQSLQVLLVQALAKKKAALSRRQPGDDDKQFSLINYNGPFKGMRVGEYFDYTQGHQQPVAEFDEKAEELTLTTMAPKDKSNFLHSILYFGILGDHVVLSQSSSLRAPQFESYLNWLLVETGTIKEGDFVVLADCIPEKKKRQINSTKGIEFHAPVRFEASAKTKDGVIETKSISFSPKGMGMDWLKQILPSELSLPKQIRAEDLIKNGDLRVTLYLAWSRVGQDDSTAVLDRISNQLRHADTELDYTIHTRSGKITKDEIKLGKSVSVAVNKDDLVLKSDMWEKMKNWLQSLSDEGRVPPLV